MLVLVKDICSIPAPPPIEITDAIALRKPQRALHQAGANVTKSA